MFDIQHVNLKIQKLHSQARIPERAYPESAGLDLFSIDEIYLPAIRVTPVSLGIATEFSPSFVAVVKDRSSMGKAGIHVVGGVIDADYRGEWIVLLYNHDSHDYYVNHQDRVAQVLFLPRPTISITEVLSLSPSARGKGGWGSSGR